MEQDNDLIGQPVAADSRGDSYDYEASPLPEPDPEAEARAQTMLAVRLVERLQTAFPVATYPYENLSKEFGVSERGIFDAVERLLEEGAITRVGATFEPARVGYVAALCSMAVESDDVDAVSDLLKPLHSVTHLAQVDDERNLWFMMVIGSRKELDQTLAQLANKTGYDVEVMRPTHIYKNDFTFAIDPTVPKQMTHPTAPIVLASTRPAAMSDIDRQIARVLEGDISGERRPFSVIARMTADTCGEHLSEEEVIKRISRWCDSGVIRRVGAVIDPEKFGYPFSAIVTWDAPDKLLPVLAPVLAAQPETTRVVAKADGTTGMGNLYAVIYGHSANDYTEMCTRVEAMLKKANLTVPEHTARFVTKSLKDVAPRYFA